MPTAPRLGRDAAGMNGFAAASAGMKGFAVAEGLGLFDAVLPFVPDPEPSLWLRSSKTAAPETAFICKGQVECWRGSKT